jgi:putative MATE family efflux protein
MNNQSSIYRQFWTYTIPTVAAMLVNGLYQVVDGIFIGRYIGSDGLAAINLAWPIIGAVLGLGMLVGVGTGALVSIKQGGNAPVAARQGLTTGLLLLVLLAPLVSLALYFFSDSLLLWQGADPVVFDLAKQYLMVLMWSAVFTLGSIALPFLIRNDSSPNIATGLMVVGAVINIILDYILIAVMGWELFGAALATAVAQMLVTLLAVGYFFTRIATIRLSLKSFYFDYRSVPTIFGIGTSSFFMYFYGAAMVALHNTLFTQYGDVTMVGAYAILGYIVTVYYLVSEGIANGMQPLVSFNHGASLQHNVRKLLHIAMGTATALGVVFIVGLNLYSTEFVSIFVDNDQTLIDYTVEGIRLHLFALFLDGFLVVVAAFYQAINRGGRAMGVMVGNMLIQLPFLYVLPKHLGVEGIWLAYPLSNIAITVVVIGMLASDIKRFYPKQAVQVG